MQLVILLSILALVVGDYPPAKPADSYGTPADEPSPVSETPSFSTFSSKNHFNSFPNFYHSSYPYSYSSYPYSYSSYPYSYSSYPYYSNHFSNFKPQYNLGYKPFSSVNFNSPARFPPILDGSGLKPILPPSLFPPNVLPPNVLPPNVFPPSVQPPVDLPQITGFSSPYFSSAYSPLSYSFPSFTSFQSSPFFGKKKLSKVPKHEEAYGPPAENPVETPAPAEAADDAPVSYPYEAAEGSSSESPEPEYGPPSSKH